MADTFNTAAAATQETVNRGFLGDSISAHTAMLWKMRQNGNVKLVSGGNPWKCSVLLYESTNVQAVERLEEVSLADQDPMRQASFTPKAYLCAVPIYEADLLDNENDATRIVSLLMGQVKAAKVRFENVIDDHIITSDGTTTKQMDGLASAIVTDPTAVSPGGLSGNTYANWRNQTSTSFGNFAAEYEAKLLALWIACVVGNDHPDLILSNSTIWTKFHNIFVPGIRYEDTAMANMGFENVKYRGAAWFYDSNSEGGVIRMLNTKHMEWRIHRKAFFSMTDWQKGTSRGQWARVALMALYSNLFFTNLKRHGYAGGVT